MQIHIINRHERRPIPEFVPQKAQDDNRRREVILEEIGHILADRVLSITHWRKAGPELPDQDQSVQGQSHPRTEHTSLRRKR